MHALRAEPLRGSLEGGTRMTFRQVYDAHFRFVWWTLRRLNVAEADVADTVQDVFLVVHRRLPEFEGRAKITTWLFRICLRVARERQRRSHVRREVSAEAELAKRAAAMADPEQLTQRRRDLVLLEAALEQMDLDQRAVFTLFEFEGMTGQEISAALQIPLGTVYSRLRLARESFRKAVLRHRPVVRLMLRTGEKSS